ncbi:MAG: hypothetical protein NZM35_02410 [Chitinophagales bacterium]|nr:hypothetical protein [Chitinophagales bacterium]MDW8417939.1 hypothetical protein [Chitinophagales bacterium]
MKSVLFLFLIGLSHGVGAQYSLIFCEDVTRDGKPTAVSNSFMVDEDGGMLKFLLKAEDGINTDKIEYRILYVHSNANEEEVARMSQNTEPTWNYAWKEVIFFDPGTYKVKVYTGRGSYLTAATLTIQARW